MNDSLKVDKAKYMTRSEAAAYLGITFDQVGPLLARGVLAGITRGHWQYVERLSAEKYKKRRRMTSW